MRQQPGSWPEAKLDDVEGLHSDLDLHQGAHDRARPRLGEWGPVGVPSTRFKQRMRWIAAIAFVLAASGLFAFGWFIYTLLMSVRS